MFLYTRPDKLHVIVPLCTHIQGLPTKIFQNFTILIVQFCNTVYLICGTVIYLL